MRILLHDFGGYAFAVQLARWLAGQGHCLLHLRSGDVLGPQGAACRRDGDPDGLEFVSIGSGRPFARYALHRRILHEVTYGRQLGSAIRRFGPDVVLSANAPPIVQRIALRAARRRGAAFVNWVQDIFSFAGGAMPAHWPGWMRSAIVAGLRHIEFGAMQRADGLVVIAPDFAHRLKQHGLSHPRTLVQENWAPQPDPAGQPRPDDWMRSRGLAGKRILLAAGTLGLKHNALLLAELARALRDDSAVRVVVSSQGPGREQLEAIRAAESLTNLVLLDYQPPDQVPDMLAAAELGVILLNRAASAMSVPSKLYSYAAAGRAVLAAVPVDNLAGRIVRDQGLGLAVEPEDAAGFVAAARRLLSDSVLRDACGRAARDFARQRCDIAVIGPRFEALLAKACADRVTDSGSSDTSFRPGPRKVRSR